MPTPLKEHSTRSNHRYSTLNLCSNILVQYTELLCSCLSNWHCMTLQSDILRSIHAWCSDQYSRNSLTVQLAWLLVWAGSSTYGVSFTMVWSCTDGATCILQLAWLLVWALQWYALCLLAQMALPASKVEGVLLSAIKKNTNAPTTNLGIYNSRYLCIRKNFVTMRGVIMKANDSLATAVRDTLNTWLSEQGSSVVIGDRQVGIRPGLCGLALSTVNDPVCGRDYPALASSTPPNTSQNTQSGSSSSLAKDVESLKISLVSVCFVCGGLLIAITILAAYVLYRRWRRKSKRWRCAWVGKLACMWLWVG